MGRLMRSLGYAVEVFPSGTDLLASPRLVETSCLIADVNMPAMTGLELYRNLIENLAKQRKLRPVFIERKPPLKGRALFIFDPDGNETEVNTRYLYEGPLR